MLEWGRYKDNRYTAISIYCLSNTSQWMLSPTSFKYFLARVGSQRVQISHLYSGLTSNHSLVINNQPVINTVHNKHVGVDELRLSTETLPRTHSRDIAAGFCATVPPKPMSPLSEFAAQVPVAHQSLLLLLLLLQRVAHFPPHRIRSYRTSVQTRAPGGWSVARVAWLGGAGVLIEGFRGWLSLTRERPTTSWRPVERGGSYVAFKDWGERRNLDGSARGHKRASELKRLVRRV